MAIAFETDAVAEANATSVTVTKPSGTASGDVLVAFWISRGSESDANMTLPSGWSQAAFDGGQNPSCKVAYLVAGGSEPANYTFTTSVSRSQGAWIGRFSGVDTTSVSDATAGTGTGTSTSPSVSAITTSTANAYVLWFAGCLAGTIYTITKPSGMTDMEDFESGSRVNIHASYLSQASAGSTGTQTGTLETSATWIAAMWAIKPAATSVSLTVADATQGHTVDNLTLTQHNVLAVADAAQGHTVDGNLALVQHNVLAVQDAGHGHTADGPLALTQHNTLAVQDAAHAHTADNLALTQHNVLAVQDATHAHTADNLDLVQHNVLAVADATHAHTADNLDLTVHNGAVLVIQDATHGHTADSLALTQHNVLVVHDAYHFHYADGPIGWPGSGTLGNDMGGLWSVFLRRKKRRKVRFM